MEGGGGELIMAGRANRMRAASCCDININTLYQLLVTDIPWTKQGQRCVSLKGSRGNNGIITCAIFVVIKAQVESTSQDRVQKGSDKANKDTVISWKTKEGLYRSERWLIKNPERKSRQKRKKPRSICDIEYRHHISKHISKC